MKKSMIETYIRMYGMLRYIMRMNEAGHYPKMEEILQHCTFIDEGREEKIHANTFHKYMKEAERLLGLHFEIIEGYRYKIDNLVDWSSKHEFLKGWLDTLWLHSVIDLKGELQKYILFEPLPEEVKYVPEVLMAIWKRHPISIKYRKLGEKKIRHYDVEARGLRQSKNRYYMIAYDKAAGKNKNLAFHAMKQVDVLYSETYKEVPFSIEEYYRNSYGTWVEPGKEATDIRLRAMDDFWAEQLQTPPFHHSLRQLDKKQGTKWTDFIIHVVPMPDLVLELQRLSPHILVLDPPELRDYMKHRLQVALDAYDSPDEPLPELTLPDKFSRISS